ncbi:alcohol dehydrogenase catalytic domain-containing protein [Rhodococcus sp. USK13]|uniref:alcohol dehydrogenase catalytic domain-containing protein n=1 Tax=Rhodococcus sp. USK13 TaxID=2806442 RepID=UPI0032D5804A
MKAARLHTFGTDFVIEEVPTPTPGPGQVLIRVAGAGACHSDLHIKSGEVQGVVLPHSRARERRLGRVVRRRR